MKKTAILLIGLSTVLAACASEPDTTEKARETNDKSHEGHQMGPLSDKAIKDKKEAADLLVERFAVEACAKADLIGSLRRTEPDGGGSMMRAYQVPVACAEETIASVKQLGFEEGEPGTFAGASSDGSAEGIKIQVLEDGVSATIEWELDQK